MDHDHSSHTHAHTPAEETLALLKYMAHHNAHHAEELMETTSLLDDNTAKLIKEAVELLNKSTEKIKQAINKAEE